MVFVVGVPSLIDFAGFVSALWVVLLPFVDIDFALVDLGSDVAQHALDTALLSPLHLLIKGTRICDHVLQV